MLYIMNKSSEESLRQLAVIAADDDEAAVLLVSDAVFLGTTHNLRRFADMDIEAFHAAQDAAEARAIELDDDVEVLDYNGMAALVEDYDKVITL